MKPTAWPSRADEVEHLILNAQLRDELEPFYDESVDCVDFEQMTTETENEFLASLLAWEYAPVLPLSQWFEPELTLAHPDSLDDAELHAALWDALIRMQEKQILLEYSDHLNDRQLYCILYRDILASREKRLDHLGQEMRWRCIDLPDDRDVWLRYYATETERQIWADMHNESLPPAEPCPYPRRLPR